MRTDANHRVEVKRATLYEEVWNEFLALLVVVPAPILKRLARVVKALEPPRVQALVSKAAVERLDVRVVDRFPRPDEVDIDAAEIRPSIEV
jgi:hypothetical protein